MKKEERKLEASDINKSIEDTLNKFAEEHKKFTGLHWSETRELRDQMEYTFISELFDKLKNKEFTFEDIFQHFFKSWSNLAAHVSNTYRFTMSIDNRIVEHKKCPIALQRFLLKTIEGARRCGKYSSKLAILRESYEYWEMSENRHTPIDVLEKLVSNKIYDIRLNVAEHQNASIEMVKSLCDDKSARVRVAASRRLLEMMKIL
tara:strand:+ start:35 stop:646 length:612 start_codon:yes stop_codon:yes gene_type:complete